MPPLVSLRKDTWEKSAEISYWRRNTTEIRVSASDWLKFASTNEKDYLDLGSDASSVWDFCTCFSDVFLQETCGGFTKINVGCFLRLFAHLHVQVLNFLI